MKLGDHVRVKRGKHSHPWRRRLTGYVRRVGVITEIREVSPSRIIPDGRIYEIQFKNGKKKGFPLYELDKVE